MNTQGVKTQPDWLFSFFNDPTIIRPNLQVRMPSFNFTDAEWNSIISAFQSMENHNIDFENDLVVDRCILYSYYGPWYQKPYYRFPEMLGEKFGKETNKHLRRLFHYNSTPPLADENNESASTVKYD